MDTIFIVMKKSWRQLSFLHVYHHCTIFLVRQTRGSRRYKAPVLLMFNWRLLPVIAFIRVP